MENYLPKFLQKHLPVTSSPYYGIGVKNNEGNLKWGFINKDGEVIINPIYDSVSSFYGKYAAVAIETNNNLIWGIIDINGNEIIKDKYELAYPFN